jgi:hypothetical protein
MTLSGTQSNIIRLGGFRSTNELKLQVLERLRQAPRETQIALTLGALSVVASPTAGSGHLHSLRLPSASPSGCFWG